MRTTSVLIALAIGVMVFDLPLLVLRYVYEGSPLMAEYTVLVVVLGTIVPGMLLASAILLLDGVPLRRRGSCAAAAVLLGVLYCGVADPIGLFGLPYWLSTGGASVLALAIWLAARGCRDRRWAVLAVPVIVVAAWQMVWYGAGTDAAPLKGVVAVGLLVLPFVASAVGAVVAARLDPRSDAAPGRALVDRTV